MAYKDIPLPTDFLSVSQQDIKNNFSQANATMDVNHFPFNNLTANNGKHKFVEMPVNAVIPAGLTAGEGTFYTKTISAASQVFYSPDNSTNEYQLTRTISANFGTFSSNPGWSFLPGGLLIQWGTNTTASGSTIIFPVPFTAIPYSIQCTIAQNTTNRHFVYPRSATNINFVTTQLDSGGSAESNTFSWVAIGK